MHGMFWLLVGKDLRNLLWLVWISGNPLPLPTKVRKKQLQQGEANTDKLKDVETSCIDHPTSLHNHFIVHDQALPKQSKATKSDQIVRRRTLLHANNSFLTDAQ
jgi:hypothetical protein